MESALGMIEIQGLATAIVVADIMAKTADVRIANIERAKGFGWITVKIRGDVAAVNAAITAGKQVGEQYGHFVTSKVIPRPVPAVTAFFSDDPDPDGRGTCGTPDGPSETPAPPQEPGAASEPAGEPEPAAAEPEAAPPAAELGAVAGVPEEPSIVAESAVAEPVPPVEAEPAPAEPAAAAEPEPVPAEPAAAAESEPVPAEPIAAAEDKPAQAAEAPGEDAPPRSTGKKTRQVKKRTKSSAKKPDGKHDASVLPAGETDTHESGRSDGPAVLGGPAEV